MYTPYLLILTMFSSAGEIIDPQPHLSLVSCEAELVKMQAAVEREWAVHGILRAQRECRFLGPDQAITAMATAR
jgi:hypothetical protein